MRHPAQSFSDPARRARDWRGRRPWAAAALLAGLALSGAASAAGCADLARLELADTRVVSAEDRAATGDLPAHCRVKAVVSGAIGTEVWLPTRGWNGRFLAIGNGGFGGSIYASNLAAGLRKGFAVSGNDTGHQGSDRAWMADPVKVRYWGHSATHLTTAPSKALVAAFYGQPARAAYFQGCSTGGAQAMEEAQFFPEDYDGIVAGAPGMSYAHLMLSFLWGLKAMDPPGARIPDDKLALLHRAVLAACDAQDGLRDGLVGDPLACRFDPGTIRCRTGQHAECLTAAEVETARRIYQGPRNPRTGAQIYPGFAFGSEADPDAGPQGATVYGWTQIQGGLAEQYAIPLLREMVYRDPNWDWRSFDWDRDVAEVDRRVAADITATSSDLRAFAARGGKLIAYQGWGDPLNGQTLLVDYRDQVIRRFAAASGPDRAQHRAQHRVDDFFRLFMAPGMGHCGSGPGANRLDALSALQAWVEDSEAPEMLIATRTPPGAPAPTLSRPLCAFPKVARYDGHGPVDVASSFVCTRPSR